MQITAKCEGSIHQSGSLKQNKTKQVEMNAKIDTGPMSHLLLIKVFKKL